MIYVFKIDFLKKIFCITQNTKEHENKSNNKISRTLIKLCGYYRCNEKCFYGSKYCTSHKCEVYDCVNK